MTILTAISSFGQTKVGDIQFNDIDVFGKEELMLNGAGSRDKMYAMALYLDFEVDGVEDGVMVAEKDRTMAVTIKVMTAGATSDFREVIRNGIERATDGNAYLLEDQIRDFLKILPGEINKHDIFKILYVKGGDLLLFKRKELLGKISNGLEFKKALFKIWLGENPVNKDLKKDLLASFQPNPVLGKWKTYDPETGIAISIVQLYIIKNQVFGSIERMLRLSERDAVCYECAGDDKNQKVEGLVIIKDMVLKKGKYVDGKFTDVNNGRVSDCQLWVDVEELDVLNIKYKGSGGTNRWTRVEE
ncbi:chalcone isomerase family protein [Aquimarina pacifica]|uniref:chalcone isomerase family protein n=1 Tax=Aquimarina pacifica TaxID=1296415 RepID=UPI00046FB102|nr:chalcone isomerase family protein [Aquimarina pacifica]